MRAKWLILKKVGKRCGTGVIYKDAMNAVKPAGHLKEMRNELPRGKLRVSKTLMRIYPKEVWKKLLRIKVWGIKPAEIIKMSNNSITGMPLFKYGKVKDIYDLGDRLLIVASDPVNRRDEL